MKIKNTIVATLGVLATAGTLAVVAPPAAQAAEVGCETIPWGFLLSQKRTICDTPRGPDGSWERTRHIWTPAGQVPGHTSCGEYSCTGTGGYYREESTVEFSQYRVFDNNVLQGEPGWLRTGTLAVKPPTGSAG